MAQIVFIDGRYMGTAVTLPPVATLGRSPDNTVVLEEAGIAPRHAEIRLRNGEYRVFRAAAQADITVNGKSVAECSLRHGDIVTIGALTVLFSDEPSAKVALPAGEGGADSGEDRVIESRMKQPTDPNEVLSVFRQNNRLAAHLETLYKTSAIISGTLRLDDLINALLDILSDVFGADRIFILLRDENGTLRVAGQRASATSELKGFLRVSQTIINQAVEKREGILSRDAAQDQRFQGGQSIVDQSIHSAMCSPLVRKDRILGAVHVDTLSPLRQFSELDLQLLGAITAQAALAIQNVLSYERSVEYGKQLVALSETSRRVSSFLSRDVICREAVESAARIFDCAMVSLLMLDDAGEKLRVAHSTHLDAATRAAVAVAPGQGPAGQAFAEGRPRVVNDAPLEAQRRYTTRAYMIAPIIARREGFRGEAKPVGVLCVTDRRSRRPYEPEDEQFLSIFAAQIGVSLQNARFFEKATIDELTKVFTRQFLFARLEEEIDNHRAQGAPLSVIMLDIDHFKKKNDQFGHAAGDAVLRDIAQRARETVARHGGIAGRYGGEEFTLLLPGRALAAAHGVAEEVRGVIEATPCRYEDHAIPCTASLGVAELQSAEDFHSVIKRADAALYHAKQSGRNRVVTAS